MQVTPKSISLAARETQVFQAIGAAGTVNWSIEPNRGRIDPNGVYTAPTLVLRAANVTVKASDGTQFDTAAVTLDPGWLWIHFLGIYWLAWALMLLAIFLGRWELLCPSCRPPELLLSPPLATVTASQPIRFSATAPATWPANMNASGLFLAPPAAPANPSIEITVASVADPGKTAGASLIWSPDVGIILQPQHAAVFGEGQVDLNPILTAAPDKQGQIDLAKVVIDWLQPAIGRISPQPDGTAVYHTGQIQRAATITIMANAHLPGGPLRPAGAYIFLLPRSPARACRDDGTPGWESLIALIALAGALGGLIHGASSFAIFAGNREFKPSWTWWYVLRPVMGAAVALVVYLVVRGGVGSSGLALAGANCLTIAGFAGLIGMFAEPATLKLKDIFDTVFTPKHDPRKDVLKQ